MTVRCHRRAAHRTAAEVRWQCLHHHFLITQDVVHQQCYPLTASVHHQPHIKLALTFLDAEQCCQRYERNLIVGRLVWRGLGTLALDANAPLETALPPVG